MRIGKTISIDKFYLEWLEKNHPTLFSKKNFSNVVVNLLKKNYPIKTDKRELMYERLEYENEQLQKQIDELKEKQEYNSNIQIELWKKIKENKVKDDEIQDN